MLKQRNKTSLRPVIQNNVGRYLVLFVFVFASCRTLDYPPKAYVRYELENAILLIDKNDIQDVLGTKLYDPSVEQTKRILKDYSCLSTPIILKDDSLYLDSNKHLDIKWNLMSDVNSCLYDLFKKHKPIVYDKRRKVFDRNYYFKEDWGWFYIYFEDGQIFYESIYAIIE